MYIVMGRNFWGKGKTESEAISNMKKCGGKTELGYIVFEVDDPDAFITYLGRIHSSSEPREVRRSGVKLFGEENASRTE